MIELNRIAFSDYLPKYSESRCIAISIKLIKKNAPQIKWVLSFSDSTLCGDGTIYRASGFSLTSIKENSTLGMLNGKVMADFTLQKGKHILLNNGKAAAPKEFEYLKGFQIRYIYLIDKTCKLTVPILPFSKIDEMGAGMYKGKKITFAERKLQAIEA